MTVDNNTKIECVKCKRVKKATDFFTYKDGTKDNMCKTCLTEHIDNKDPQTFLWILEKFDIPYVDEVWTNLYNKIWTKNPNKFGPASVIGQYLRTMKMVQYRDLKYSDTDKLAFKQQKENQERKAQLENDAEAQKYYEELKQQLEEGKITQAQFDTLNPLNIADTYADVAFGNSRSKFADSQFIDEDLIRNQLSEEDFQYLSLKWGISYKPSEWVRMEELFNKYASEYELNVDREQALISICKNYLKMDQALDMGDYTSYKNLASVNDQLRKSSKFTEAQNKENQTRYLDCIGELVLLCEKEGGIIKNLPDPDEYPQDKIDFTLKDLKAYNYNLVTKELGLGDLIESYIEKLEKAESADENDLNKLITSEEEELEDQLTDLEIEEFHNYLENEITADAEKLLQEIGGE